MKNTQLKSSIHELIDQIENEHFLSALHQLLEAQRGKAPGKLWGELSRLQQEEVLKAFEESEEPYQLIPKEKIFKKG